MADKKISQLDSTSSVNTGAMFPLSQTEGGSLKTVKGTVDQIGDYVATVQDHSSLTTTSKKLVGAINEKMDKANPTGTGTLSIGRKAETTTGTHSVAIGRDVEASGTCSLAEGRETKATLNQAHAEGYQSEASGNSSHAENYGTKASGAYSHAQGLYTEANHRSQHVFGEYNVADPSTATSSNKGTYVEIVGNGNNVNHSNARTLDWSGNEVLAGDLSINGNQSLSVVTNAIFSYRFNSSTNVEISAFEYSSFIILGYAQGVGSVAILLTINNGSIQNIINMKDGNPFSSSDLTLTYANSKLVIASTKVAYSTLTVIKGSP